MLSDNTTLKIHKAGERTSRQLKKYLGHKINKRLASKMDKEC